MGVNNATPPVKKNDAQLLIKIARRTGSPPYSYSTTSTDSNNKSKKEQQSPKDEPFSEFGTLKK